MAALRRDAMDEQAAFACTLALQSRLDTLIDTMPARIKDALEDPFSEGRRFVLVLIVSRSMGAWLEMFLHGRHYAQGWTDPKYDISRRIFFRAALFFIRNFLAYWDDLVQRVSTTHDRDFHHLLENSPGLMFRATPLARTSFTLLAQLERHSQLAKVYPTVVSDEEREQGGTVDQLAKQMHNLRRRFAAAFTFESSKDCPSLIPTPQATMPSLPVSSTHAHVPPHAHPIHHTILSNHTSRPPQTPGGGVTAGLDSDNPHGHPGHSAPSTGHPGNASGDKGTTATELDSQPFSLASVPVTDPMAGLDLDWLLQVPDLEPMFGTAAPPYETGMPITFEDLFLTYNPVP